jgi:hypothetical protein
LLLTELRRKKRRRRKMGKSKVHTKYVDDLYQPVPSVTTVLGVIAKPALIHAAWKLGCEGKDYRKAWGQKADVGTLTHKTILSHLTGIELSTREYSPEDVDQAETCFLKYLDWEKKNPFKVIKAETSMVSNCYGFGGTVDLLCDLQGYGVTLIDFKSGQAIYDEMAYQLAGYHYLSVENNLTPQHWMIVRIGRDDKEGFEVRSYDNIEPYWEVFKAALSLYKSIARVKEDKK